MVLMRLAANLLTGIALSAAPYLSAQQPDALLTQATQVVNEASREGFTSGNLAKLKCVGVVPKPTSSPSPEERPAVVSCLKAGVWDRPFFLTTRVTRSNDLIFAPQEPHDILFFTGSIGAEAEGDFAHATLSNGQGAAILEIPKSEHTVLAPIAITTELLPGPGEQPSAQAALYLASLQRLHRSYAEMIASLRAMQQSTMSQNQAYHERSEAMVSILRGDSGKNVASGSSTMASLAPTPAPPPPSSSTANSASTPSPGSGWMKRATGIHILIHGASEPSGYGLYSYALLAHRPNSDELPIYKAFFSALLALPAAQDIQEELPASRINITEILLTQPPPGWASTTTDQKVSFILDHYDFARSVAILSCLPQRTGTGPVLVSVLTPVDVTRNPRPVLVVDLTRAQPRLMRPSVDSFVQQAGKDNFWQEAALEHLGLTLENALEVSASALGMSKDSVTGWIGLFKGDK